MTLNETNLEKRFELVSTSQGSIQSLSFFCLHYKAYHKKIAHIWLRSLQKAKVSHRLTLVYLANDIVQNAKRKNALSFIEDFKSILKDTIPYLRDEKIKKSVDRVLSIWQDRSIYDAKFINELKSLLNNSSANVSNSTSSKQQSKVNNDSTNSIASNDSQIKSKTNDLLDSLNKLATIEKNCDKLKSSGRDNIIDRLEQGSISKDDLTGDSKTLVEFQEFASYIKDEIDERSNLNQLLNNSISDQTKLLNESQEQLTIYKSQLDYITKLRDELL